MICLFADSRLRNLSSDEQTYFHVWPSFFYRAGFCRFVLAENLRFVFRSVCSGLVKRDTLTDLGNSFKDAVGLNDDKGIMDGIEDIDVSSYVSITSIF